MEHAKTKLLMSDSKLVVPHTVTKEILKPADDVSTYPFEVSVGIFTAAVSQSKFCPP